MLLVVGRWVSTKGISIARAKDDRDYNEDEAVVKGVGKMHRSDS